MSLHILVPLDNSAWCESAGGLALQLAAAQPARVTALRVVNVRPKSGNILDDLGGRLGFEPMVVSEEMARERDNEAAALVADWTQQARLRGIEANGIVEVGGVAQTIKRHAATADLVVMGLRGETEARFPGQGGEMAAWMTEHVNVPLVFATPGAREVTRVAVGYDGSEGSKRAVAAVRRFLVPLAVPIHAIFVSGDGSGQETVDEVADQLPGCTVQGHVVKSHSVDDGLVDKAIDLGAELLVMGFRGRSAVREFLFGSATERVIMSGDLAVMAIP